MARIEIYTKEYCPYCTHAVALFKSKQSEYNEIKIDGDMEMRSTMIERSNGGYTVPQIFINNEAIGGYTDLLAIERSQRLDELLAQS